MLELLKASVTPIEKGPGDFTVVISLYFGQYSQHFTMITLYDNSLTTTYFRQG